mmetsp:Transcript_21668/g.60233  ORF Transcript_21668/g.60233 Transcript_21668/m.60233 type:complete len:272 (+) Transcript_21668:404-1219(+)
MMASMSKIDCSRASVPDSTSADRPDTSIKFSIMLPSPIISFRTMADTSRAKSLALHSPLLHTPRAMLTMFSRSFLFAFSSWLTRMTSMLDRIPSSSMLLNTAMSRTFFMMLSFPLAISFTRMASRTVETYASASVASVKSPPSRPHLASVPNSRFRLFCASLPLPSLMSVNVSPVSCRKTLCRKSASLRTSKLRSFMSLFLEPSISFTANASMFAVTVAATDSFRARSSMMLSMLLPLPTTTLEMIAAMFVLRFFTLVMAFCSASFIVSSL